MSCYERLFVRPTKPDTENFKFFSPIKAAGKRCSANIAAVLPSTLHTYSPYSEAKSTQFHDGLQAGMSNKYEVIRKAQNID